MSTGETWTLGHRPALDGLRGVAVLLVVAAHATIPATFAFATAGTVGVTVFFTLSGFLITALLLEEHARHGRISLRAFYVRRARRLLPALVVFVAAVAAFTESRHVLASLLYVGNWLPAGGEPMGLVNHTWSLAIEEQFYLVWPLVMIAALRQSRHILALVAGTGIVTSIGLRLALWDGGAGAERVYFGSDTRADALLIGCLTALALHRGSEGRAYPLAAGVAAPLLALLGFVAGFDKYVTLPAVVASLTALVVVAVARGPYAGWLTAGWLTWVGRRSYGLYLWHVPFTLYLAPASPVPWPISALVAVALSLLMTMASWQFIERPCLSGRLGQRAGVDRHGAAASDRHRVQDQVGARGAH